MKVYMGPYPEDHGKREIEVEIHNYDLWSMDITLAFIIHPMLVKMKEIKHKGSIVDDEDVPEQYRSTAARPLTKEELSQGHTDEYFFDRWDYVLDEMIWAFGQLVKEDGWEFEFHKGPRFDSDGYNKALERMQNGFRLFGKYYTCLWD